MSNDRVVLSTLQDLCRDVLGGTVKLEEFYTRWPKAGDTSSFLRQIHDDIEDGIQHTPGHFLKEGINHEAWKKSYPYLAVYLDLSLLNLNFAFEDLEQHRKAILKSKPQSTENVDELLARLIDRTGK
ncbi:MAG TPA: hypothetical protein PLZ37_13985 [Nitrospira sp.]|nr:hypothetical protein [Nitrospira sp.]